MKQVDFFISGMSLVARLCTFLYQVVDYDLYVKALDILMM